MSNTSPITTLGGILEGFLTHEKKMIAEFEQKHGKIPHGPTIGDTYEGLTTELLSKAIPEEFNLRITNGFIIGKDGSKSGQIDCMLVRGAGSPIPKTDSEIMPIENVLAVLEVKKTLYGGDFADVLDHFDQLMVLEPNHSKPIPAGDIFRTFSQITGLRIEKHEEIREHDFHHRLVYHSLVSELIRPVRIAIGYDGFKKESGFRKSFIGLIEGHTGRKWIPPTSWPDLIISGEFSMVKMNGRPYVAPSRDDYWNLFATSRVKPIHLLLELLYTRISKDLGLVEFWGEDLELEVFNHFLQAKAIDRDGKQGWDWLYLELDEKKLGEGTVTKPWAPYFPDKGEVVLFSLLANLEGGVEINMIKEGLAERAEALIEKVKKTGLVASRGDKLFLTTEQLRMGFLCDGRCFVGEDNTGRLSRWAIKETGRLKKESNL
ncbi:hypothetical protein QEH52_01570 [Coraliomargarita sp. SDUM461003]|uniref:DUF6602 domain-containing protein n=1 Tax=Thalassobacterium maritimum TaxID=3041265 RepID=A0ABU1ASR1_9BACT|nr:DUF6602 domain-containing protein [Coraliomargarita sp. SDUM461003]MDQ8206180.1 hypothetical protein [Coraliomargarita sp. SDUM461003]